MSTVAERYDDARRDAKDRGWCLSGDPYCANQPWSWNDPYAQLCGACEEAEEEDDD